MARAAPPEDPSISSASESVLAGGGEMGVLMRALDWGKTPLGAPETWPQSLRTAVSILLESRFPMYIAWGPEFVQFYNDGYRPILGSTKHPAALGGSSQVTFAESWHIIGPMFEGVRRGTAVGAEDWMLPLDRHGYLEECYFTFSYSPIRDESGGVGGVLVTVSETTGRVVGERRLQTLRDLAARAGVVQREAEAWSGAAEALAGNRADVPFALLYRVGAPNAEPELTGVAGFGDAPPSTPRAAAAKPWPLAEVLATGVAQEVNDVALRFGALPGGQWPEAPRTAMILPIARPGGEPYGVLVAGVSARRKLDDDYRGFLQLAVDHVAAAVGNARAFLEAKQRAEALAELDRAKTAFFSNVSHELRTPLTLMLAPLEDGLADGREPLPPAQRERLEMVRRNGLRLQKLVNTLLDFSRIEAGRAAPAFAPTDLAALTKDLTSSFESALAAAGLALIVDCPPLPEPIYVDPAMWEKIVLNLLSNAFKFTFQGSIRVTVRSEGARAVLAVEDTGTGIPAAELPRIFERFHRVEGARGRSHEGTGIGLALVRELVQLHGGEVEVTSAIGRGTKFTVRIPSGTAHLPADRVAQAARALETTGVGSASFLAESRQWGEAGVPAKASPAEEAAGSSQRPTARVLVADDNADMRAYLTRILSEHWKVDAVGDGAQALAAVRAGPPDLVLADVMMPVQSGLELVAALRADPVSCTIPVLLLSARAGEEAVLDGLRSGADAYMVKPFTANELVARVRAQLEIARMRQEAVRVERAHAESAERLLDEARRATLAREETLAVVSHDLRNPLNAIITSTQILEMSLGDESAPRVRRSVDAIRRATTRMRRLIEDLLDLASIDAGSLSLDLQEQTAGEIMRETREMFESLAAEKGIALITEVAADVPALVCDKGRVLQALGNLVSNAVKFTGPPGSVVVRASAEASSSAVRFSVTDDGPGISPAMQPHLFDRHWHAHRENIDGHGLGLSIANGIVEKHGGQIHVESAPGAGSTFWFSLPTAQGAQAMASAAQATPAAREPSIEATRPASPESTFLRGGGEMGARTRAFDWSTTSLGAVEDWPQSLRTSVSTMLRSPYPITMFWGPELVMLYNDPFIPIHGAKHPAVLGMPAPTGLVEAWGQLGPLVEGVLASGESLFIENAAVVFERGAGGLKEEAYFTWCYIPTADEAGGIAGLFAISSETTRQVVGGRRLTVLRELSIRTALDKNVDAVFQSVEDVLAQAGADLPFALLYVVEEDGARLVACSGVERGSPGAAVSLKLDQSPWPLARVASSQSEEVVESLDQTIGRLPGGPWPEPATRALLLPVAIGADVDGTAVLVAGLSPLRPLDEEYRSFLQLLGRQIAASASSARAYDQERQRAEQLAELDRAKTAFFSNVSHEFRTPLTLILGPVEDALARPSRSLDGEQLELVRRNTLRLGKMVNTLLDFSRMEAGRAEATYVPTDLSAFTAGLASAFRATVESAKIAFVVDCPPLPEAIYVDPEMWEKIVLNLLSNAVKYTHRGEIRVSLRWQDEMAVLTVTDTGVGIPADDLPRVFERFYRVRSTQGRSHEGTGIGLALVQELVKLHDGSVSVTSTLGGGSTFTVRLPRGAAHLASERVERASRPRTSPSGVASFIEEANRWAVDLETKDLLVASPARDAAPQAELASARILLVDDNADLRAYVAAVIGRSFPNVETARDGNDALERVAVRAPDLILSDVMMPGLDGFGLIRALRAGAHTRAIPIILLSARAGDESTVEGLASGADDYLVKPFSARELMARVHTHLEMARVRREAARHEVVEAELRDAVRTRDDWLNLVGHELRTPVSALSLGLRSLVRGLAQEREAGVSADVLKTRAQTAERLLQRLERRVEELVSVSDLVTGSCELSLETLDLTALVSSFADAERAGAGRAGCSLEVTASGAVVGRFDGVRLRQALGQLLDNALKFGAGRPVQLLVGREGDEAVITIVDHGPGVPEEARARLFNRFERAASADHYGGLGLGLWVARRIVAAHRGAVTLGDTPGGGATLRVTLPLSAPE